MEETKADTVVEKPVETTSKKDNMWLVMVILMIVLVAFGSYVFFAQKPVTAVEDNYQYSNGQTIFEVNKVSDIETYITLLTGEEKTPIVIHLRNDPLSLEDITVSGVLNTRIFNDDEVFITIHPEANLTGRTTLAALEIDKIIDNKYLYNIPVSSAMTVPYGEYPVKTCSDGRSNSTVIWLTLGSETTVYTDRDCIVVVGTDEDELIRAADRMILGLLGIMK